MKVPFLDLKIVPEKKEGLLSRISKVFSHGQFIMGPEHDELEQVLAEYVSRKYALAVGSGTDALYLTFKSLGVSFGDEVITTPLSWIASTNAFAILGAQPVFVDVREDLNIDPSEVAKLITTETKAILAVDYAGLPCDYDALQQIANEYNIPLVEDGSQAFGAEYKGIKVGRFGVASCVSLNPMKSLAACGEAGVIFTDNDDLAESIKIARYNGMLNKEICVEPGVNARLDTLQAAILLERLPSMAAKLAKREDNASYYMQALQGCVDLPAQYNDRTNGRFLFLIGHSKRDLLLEYMLEASIEVRVRDNVLISQQPAYVHCKKGDLNVAENRAKIKLAIPVSEALTPEARQYVADKIIEFTNIYGPASMF